MALNHTHDAAARSWLDAANLGEIDFPIQNLPLGVFRRKDTAEAFRGGVAIGDHVLDLGLAAPHLTGDAQRAAQACAQPVLNDLLDLGPPAWHALRHGLFAALRDDADPALVEALRPALLPLAQIEHALPVRIGDYTDFYTSLDHAANVGKLMSPPLPVMANFRWLPIAYHGRVSSIGVSGQRFRRPLGQSMAPGASAPTVAPCARLDYELEMGIVIGRGNAQGEPITLDEAEAHIFGMCLLNDWSARDHQFWEMAPLGPFLGKNFATTVSPWLVTMEALQPFRLPWTRVPADPQPLAYLDGRMNRASGALDIHLDVHLDTALRRSMGVAPAPLSRTNFRHQYWTVAQMVAQHTVGGCNLQPGDLLGTGTISGPDAGEAGAIIELSEGGRKVLKLEGSSEERTFLLDGDAVILRGWCEAPGHARIGFGACSGEVLPALSP